MPDRSKRLHQLIKKINQPDRTHVLAIIKDERERIWGAPGGLYKHQNWRNGYIDHVVETMSIACFLYRVMSGQRPLSFTLSDALFVLFFHDVEKIFKITIDTHGHPIRTELASDPKYRSANVILKRLRIPLTKSQKNALAYVEGEKNDYHPTKRIMNPLAAFVHCCDTISARIWFDEPKKSGLLTKL